MADEIEGVRSAAWHALCAALTRYGYVEPDDLPGLPLADAFVEAFAERGYAVAEVGRLLPSGGEVKTQWAVRWHLVGGGVDEQDCYRNARETAEQRARRLAANPPMGAVRGEALKRVKYIGPWSPVVSDSSEVPDVS